MCRFVIISLGLAAAFVSRDQPAHAELILNEALANEIGSATTLEWVEVLNWPDSGTAISLDGYRYVDGGDTTTIDTNLSVPLGGFVILARKITGTSSFESTWGDNSGVWGDHAVEAYTVITVAGISLRNSSDTVRLVSPIGNASALLWKSDAGDGISIERIRPGANDDISNFAFCRDSHGSTPARHNSVLPARSDLRIDSVWLETPQPTAGQPLMIHAAVTNAGFGIVENIDMSLWKDIDPTASGMNLSHIIEWKLSPLAELESKTLTHNWTDAPPGIQHLAIRIDPDGDTTNNGAALDAIVRFTRPEIIISEFLANPEPGGSEEWIELANVSGQSINLEGFHVGDSLNVEEIPLPATEMPQGQFWVLCESEIAFRSYYPEFDGTVQQIAGWRALNNSGDGIRLFGAAGEIVDSLTFIATFPDNRSIERVELTPTFATARDWAGSTDPDGATPGRLNSVMRGDPGLLVIDSVWTTPESPTSLDTITVHAALRNPSFGPAVGWELYMLRDLDLSAPGAQLLLLESVALEPLKEGSSATTASPWINAPPGVHRLMCLLRTPENAASDTAVIVFTISYASPLIIISEYMASPTASGPGEWIEIYNASNQSLSLAGVLLGDSSGSASLPPPAVTLDSGSFIVVAQDEDQFRSYYSAFDRDLVVLPTWRTLSDIGDGIQLLGPSGEIIDSLSYGRRDEGNVSIERRQLVPAFAHPLDWGVSIDPAGATPGRANSIERLQRDLSLDSFQVAGQNLVRGGSVLGLAWISNRGFGDVLDATLEITYEPGNETQSEELQVRRGLRSSQIVTWTDLPPGIGTLSISVAGDDTPLDNRIDLPLAVAFLGHECIISEYLADPKTPGPGEWIELISLYSAQFNLGGLKFGDAVSVSDAFNDYSKLAQPGLYFVLAEDSNAFRDFYPGFSGHLLSVGDWPALNNDGDLIKVLGPAYEMIDSTSFTVTHGENRSVERLDISAAFAGEDDWVMSIDPSGATPGRPNSVNATAAGSLQVAVSPNPAFRSAGHVTRIDYRLDIGERLTLKVFDSDGRPVRTIAEDIPSATGFMEWDGTDDDGALLRPGPYVLLAKSEPTGSMTKTVVVIAP